MGILQTFTLLGALGMFLYGMNLMSSGLQKAAGDKLRGLLILGIPRLKASKAEVKTIRQVYTTWMCSMNLRKRFFIIK